jgi:hypothetical protein
MAKSNLNLVVSLTVIGVVSFTITVDESIGVSVLSFSFDPLQAVNKTILDKLKKLIIFIND